MLELDRDYRWSSEEGLSINWNDKWNKIDVPGYVPVDFIAPGANGVTYKAFHKITNRHVVIKVWKPKENNYQERFLNEVQKVAALRHDSIVIIHDGKVLPEGFCIAVYEFIQGKPLKEWLKAGPSIDERLLVCRDILDAVHYYQSEGILHGDLHNGNILISQDLHPTIIDFGTSAFSPKQQTKDRELFFVSNLITSLLKPCRAYDINHFSFRPLHRPTPHIEPITEGLCAFSYEPILMTETMQQYTGIMELTEYRPEFDMQDIVTFAAYVSQSFYLDTNRLIDDIANRHINPNLRRRLDDAIELHSK